MSGPIAGQAKKGSPKAKYVRRYEARLNAYINPQGDAFKKLKDVGGVHAPGSRKQP